MDPKPNSTEHECRGYTQNQERTLRLKSQSTFCLMGLHLNIDVGLKDNQGLWGSRW